MQKAMMWLAVLCAIVFSSSAHAGTVFTISTPDPESAAVSLAAKRYAGEIASRTNGAITLAVHSNGELFAGDPGRAIRMAGSGSLDLLLLPASLYANQKARFVTLSFPYLFASTEQLMEYLQSEAGDTLKNDVEELNIHVIDFWPRPFRALTNSKHPIASPDDLRGMRLRVPNNRVWMEYFHSMGALPTPIQSSEIYPALAGNLVDGQENPASVPMDAGFYAVQKYITMSNHIADVWVLGINGNTWNALTMEQKKVMTEAAESERRANIQTETEELNQTLAFLESKGMEVRKLRDDERQRFVDAAEALYSRFTEMVGDREFVKQALRFVGKAE